ncbi:MAG: DUF2953 domain-containing protein [Clostridia bacterium]|nr:DUF2953 domain-containing protein [Clostridia bacterium]
MRYVWVGLLTVLLTVVVLLIAIIWHRWSIYLRLKERRLVLELRGFGFRRTLFDRDFSVPKPQKPKSKQNKPQKENRFSGRWKPDTKKIYDEEKGGYQSDGIRTVVGQYLELWEELRETFRALFDGMRYKIEICDTRLYLTFGTGNPAHTGMAYGAAWSAIGAVYPILCRYFRMEYPQVDMQADFNTKRFDAELESIIKIRPAHIIHAGFKECLRMAVTYLRNNKDKDKGSGEHVRKQTSH